MPSENFVTIDRWGGLFTTLESNRIPIGSAAVCEGCDLRSGSLASERGYSVFGNLNQSAGKITSGFDAERRDGTEMSFVLWDNGTTATLYVLHTADTTNSADGEWEQLVTSRTTGYDIGGVGFNTLTADNVIFGNAIQQSMTWDMLFTRLTVAAALNAATITVASTTGFAASGSFQVTGDNGTLVTVTYSGITATTFTGCTGMPATRVLRMIATIPAASSAAPYSNKWITADGRVWAVGVSGSDGSNSVRLYFSTVADHTNWTDAGTPDGAGFRNFEDVGGRINGLASLRGSSGDFTIWVFGNKGIASYALEYPSSTTRVAKSRTFRDKSGVNGITHYGIANVLNDIWFVTNENSVFSLFSPEAKEGFDTDMLTDDIRPTMEDMSFTRARATFWDKEKRYLLAGRSDTTVTDNDKVIDIQFVKDQLTGKYKREINILPWAVGCWLRRGGNLYFGSSVESRVYRAFNGYTSGQAGTPVNTRYVTRRFNKFGNLGTFNEKGLEYNAFRGLIAVGTTINFKAYFDAGGIRGSSEGTLIYNDSGLVMEINTVNSLGQFTLGSELLAGLTGNIEDMNPFLVYFVIDEAYTFFDIQFEINMSGEGSQFIINEMALKIKDPEHTVSDTRKKSLATV